MRAFAIAVVVVALMAIGGGFGLNAIQESASAAYHTSAARLDQLETVTDYARELPGVNKQGDSPG